MKDKTLLILAYLISKRTITYSVLLITLMGIIITSIVNYEVKRKIQIQNLNEIKEKTIASKEIELKPLIDRQKELLKELELLNKRITPIKECISGINSTLDTFKEYNCDTDLIPKASADSITPSDLFYTYKVSDGCHISQNEQQHFTKAGGYMLATDVACDFNKDGKADQAIVYTPDYLNQEKEYILYSKQDDLLGDYVELVSGNIKWIIGHTTTKLKDGDVVQTGQIIGQNNLTGFTTGYHSHIELWILIDGKRNNISYTTRSETLNNKRNNILSQRKEGNKFYFTSYHLGDVNQNDSSPYIGASGKDLRHISNPIALTVDVRQSLGIKFGDKVKLTGPCTGEYQVEDEMNQRFRYSNIMKDGVPIKGDLAIPLGTEAKCSGVYSIIKI